MPIRPEHRWLYPIDWPELSRLVRFRRAKGRCEGCGRPHGREVHCVNDGRWWDEERGHWRDDRSRRARGLPRPGREHVTQPALIEGVIPNSYQVTRVVLASAHRDHDPGNNDLRNLKPCPSGRPCRSGLFRTLQAGLCTRPKLNGDRQAHEHDRAREGSRDHP